MLQQLRMVDSDSSLCYADEIGLSGPCCAEGLVCPADVGFFLMHECHGIGHRHRGRPYGKRTA